jgi:hypothetical protein
MTEPQPAPAPAPAQPTTIPTDSGGALRGVRRVAVIAIIASMSITAVVGIIALLSGEFGDTQVRILLTTLLITGFSLTALCHLAIASRPVRVVGFVGIGVSLVALMLGVLLIWLSWGGSSPVTDEILRWFAISGVVALSLAQANLLLLLAGRRHPVVRIALGVTLAAIAGVALLAILPILTNGEIPGTNGDAYARTIGVVAIIDALGTVVLPVVALFLRDDRQVAAQPSSPVGADLERRIAALGSATGLDRTALLSAALDEFEAARREPDRR